MLKQECRDLYKSKRLQLTEKEITSLDQGLLRQLQLFDWKPYRRVHIFLSMQKFKEPDTLAFIDWIHETIPTIQLVVSKTDFKIGMMENYLYDDHIIIQQNAWGIPEPIEGIRIEDSTIDAVIVPMLVCDRFGNRVGFGKGFYDRFLANCRADIVTIGLSFFEPITRIMDVEPWDYALDYCITPEKIIKF